MAYFILNLFIFISLLHLDIESEIIHVKFGNVCRCNK